MKNKHLDYLPVLDFRDVLEIIFGVVLGLLVFLGASELWQIGVFLDHVILIIVMVINFFLLYFLTKFIAGKVHKGSIFIESIRYPLKRSIVVYLIGLVISLFVVWQLERVGVLQSLIGIIPKGFFPPYFRVGVFANLFATLFAVTIDLSIVE